jgi:putative ABC transport system ATP-binding protein
VLDFATIIMQVAGYFNQKTEPLRQYMGETVIAFERVSKAYDGRGGVLAMSSVDLSIDRGETIAVMGPSGSGKSTLLNLACGLDEPTSGKVLFEGVDLAEMNDDDRTRLRRQKIGMIFQRFNLLATLTAAENVSLPLRLNGTRAGKAHELALAMLDRVGLRETADSRPDEMSGGERQRVAIARALIFDPPILLADEPTGNLDSKTGADILDILDAFHRDRGTTIVLVTHNDQAAERCKRRITLHDGRILEDILMPGVTGVSP